MRKYVLVLLLSCSCTINAQIQSQFTTDAPIYVVGDVHGAYSEIIQTLTTLGLVDKDHNWIGDNAHFISLGDILDRGPAPRKVMDLYISLQEQAETAGGKFHLLLGNHEVMNLTGDLRYLSKKEISEFALDETEELRNEIHNQYFSKSYPIDDAIAQELFDKKYPAGYFARQLAFQASGKYGKWLLGMPFIIKINDQIFTHGGLSKGIGKLGVEDLNQTLTKTLQSYMDIWKAIYKKYPELYELTFSNRAEHVNKLSFSALKDRFFSVSNALLFRNESPIWYRGNSICHPYFETDNLSRILNRLSAKELWVGHTPTPELKVRSRLNKLLTVMDTGMLQSYYKGEPWVAKITNNANPIFINGLSGKHEQAIISPNRNSPNPHNMTDQEVEAFLKTAEIIEKEGIGEGVTKPIKVTLSLNGVTIHAVFKNIDSKPGNERGRWRKDIYDADRYKYEVAAYKLDRMLHLGLVPVTVERIVDGKQGALQLWVNNLMSKKHQKKNGIPYDGFCNFKDQVNMMDTFDYLIRNTDRNQSNILYGIVDWQVWFVDHSRSFGLFKTRPRMMKKHKIKVTDEFKKALRALSQGQLNELSPWLHKKQIRAIWERRKKLIRGKF